MLLQMPDMSQRQFEMVLTFGFLGFAMIGFLALVFAWQRGRKLKVLQEALRSGVVDGQTKR